MGEVQAAHAHGALVALSESHLGCAVDAIRRRRSVIPRRPLHYWQALYRCSECVGLHSAILKPLGIAHIALCPPPTLRARTKNNCATQQYRTR